MRIYKLKNFQPRFAFLATAPLVMVLALFVIIVAVSRYVSLGSLSTAVLLPILLIAFAYPLPVIITAMCMGLLVFIKHKDNIRRLLKREENKTIIFGKVSISKR